MIKVILADDHQVVLDGLTLLISSRDDIKILGAVSNGQEVLDLMEKGTADITVLDIDMPVMNGVETTKAIKEKYPDTKVLILTMHDEPEFISEMINLGADGYILKDIGREEFMEAIETVASGTAFYSGGVTEAIMQGLKTPAPEVKDDTEELTEREKEILQLIVKEMTTNEIAEALFISSHTVESHRKNLISKLNVRNTAGLVRYAFEHGLAESS